MSGITFDGKFAGVVGATVFHRHQPEHRAVLDDAPFIGRQHGWQQQAGQLVPTKKVALELGAQRLGWQIFQGSGLSVGSVIEQPIQATVTELQGLFYRGMNGGGVG